VSRPIALLAALALTLTGCPADDDDSAPPDDDDTVQSDDDDSAVPDDDDAGDDDDSAPPDGAVTAEIGPDGGRLDHPDGVALIVPAGALPESTELWIVRLDEADPPELPGGTEPASAIYDLGPDGTTFAEPATVEFAFAPDDLPAGGLDGLLVFVEHGDLGWDVDHPAEPDTDGDDPDEVDALHESHMQEVDPDALAVRTQTSHLSQRVLGRPGSLNDAAVWDTATLCEDTIWDVDVLRKVQETVGGNPRWSELGADGLLTGHDARAQTSHVVLHSTNNPSATGTPSSGEALFLLNTMNTSLAAGRPNRAPAAHFVVAQAGHVVQLVPLGAQVSHATGMNSRAIGIEIHNSGRADDLYPGRQLSAVSRLVRCLAHTYDLGELPADRPGSINCSWDVDDHGAGQWLVGHMEVDERRSCTGALCEPTGCRKHDPSGPTWSYAAMQASLRDEQTGLIDSSGGDGAEADTPGDAGDVQLHFDDDTVTDWFDADGNWTGTEQIALDLVVDGVGTLAEGTHEFSRIHLEGSLALVGPTTLRTPGVFYLGPEAVIEAWDDDGNGVDLTIEAGGLVVLEGVIETAGRHGYEHEAPWTGGAGGDLVLRSAAGGLGIVPTILADGGDAGRGWHVEADPPPGGDGGDVQIHGNGADLLFRGARLEDDIWPSRFWPCTTPNIYAPDQENGEVYVYGTCYAEPSEDHTWFEGGVLTSGGTGGQARRAPGTLIGMYGAAGGDGGDVTIDTAEPGRIHFDRTDLITGAGVETVWAELYESTYSSWVDARSFTGCQGGAGKQNQGVGGPGGDAGDITVDGTFSVADDALFVGYGWWGDSRYPDEPVLNVHDSEDPDTTSGPDLAWGTLTGETLQAHRPEGDGFEVYFRAAAVGGSGGFAGGSTWSQYHMGEFGMAGLDGAVTGLPCPPE